MSEAPTLYEWAGGREAIERMIGCFYDRVERDDLLSPLFPGGVGAAHREHVTTWWCEVFGGPAGYTERLGGYPAMLARHRDLGITADQRFRFASLMSLAADDADLPADPEFRAALVGYLEWGTRLAMHNSQPGTDVVQQAPVPRWGWGVAPPALPALTGAAGVVRDQSLLIGPCRCLLKSWPIQSSCTCERTCGGCLAGQRSYPPAMAPTTR